jgi:hypothetical protein
VQLRALLVVEHAESAVVLERSDLHHVRDRIAPLVGEVDRLDAPVGVGPPALGQAELLEVVHQADHRALVDPQPAAQCALGHGALGVDHGEHRRVLGADPLVGQRALETLRGVLGDERGEVARPVRERRGKRCDIEHCHVTDRTGQRPS